MSLMTVQHAQGGLSLGVAAGLRQLDFDDQSVAILHEHMPGVRQPRGLPGRLLGHAGLWICARDMRFVAALLTPEVHAGVTSATLWRSASFVARMHALHRSPGFEQGTVHGEVLDREQPLLLGLLAYGKEE